jgi:hypothetical protein
VFLINRRKALDDVIAGRINEAIRKCAPEWASLPGSSYGQPTQKLQKALEVYAAYGGQAAPQTQQPKAEVKAHGTTRHPDSVRALVAHPATRWALRRHQRSRAAQRRRGLDRRAEDHRGHSVGEPAGSGREDPERSAGPAGAKEAVAQIWPEITEAGSGGIDGARKANLAPDQPKPWKDKAIISPRLRAAHLHRGPRLARASGTTSATSPPRRARRSSAPCSACSSAGSWATSSAPRPARSARRTYWRRDEGRGPPAGARIRLALWTRARRPCACARTASTTRHAKSS